MSASAGTLIGAGLESAGYVAQGAVLDDLAPILTATTLLIFVFLSGRALLSLSTQGNYLEATKVLVFPIVVAFLLNVRTTSSGTLWQFGNLKGDQTRVEEFSAALSKPSVSWVFERFNSFVSGMSQLGIEVILENPVSSSILFTVRQQILDSVLRAEIVSPGLRSVVHEGLRGKCGEWMDAARKIARGNRDPIYQGTPDYLNAVSSYDKLWNYPSVRFQTTAPAYAYVLDLLRSTDVSRPSRTEAEELVRAMCEGTNGTLADGGKTPEQIVDAPASCAQVWCWSALGLVLEARNALDAAVDETVKQNDHYKSLEEAERARLLQEILEDLSKKVQPNEEGAGFDNDPAILPIVIAGHLLRLEMNRDRRSGIYSEFAEDSGVKLNSYSPKVTLSAEEQARLREEQSSYQSTVESATKVLSFAYSIPYLQGVILFTLALLFPFFVITSFVMRRGSGLFFWAGAWVWAKSWDVAFAVIMLVDELLWELMPHQAVYEPVAKGLHSPITILESAFDGDPTYSLATYYLLLSMLLLSVPSIMGQLLLGGAGSVSQIMFGGALGKMSGPSAQIETKKEADTFEYQRQFKEQSPLAIDPQLPRYSSAYGRYLTERENPAIESRGVEQSPRASLPQQGFKLLEERTE